MAGPLKTSMFGGAPLQTRLFESIYGIPRPRASLPSAQAVQTAKRGTLWPFGLLKHWWLGSAAKLGCDGAVTAHK